MRENHLRFGRGGGVAGVVLGLGVLEPIRAV